MPPITLTSQGNQDLSVRTHTHTHAGSFLFSQEHSYSHHFFTFKPAAAAVITAIVTAEKRQQPLFVST